MASKRDIIAAIRKYNSGLEPERLRRKYELMRKDPFAFFRGTCHLFYDRLPRLGRLARAPAAWSCGDLHLENFGSFKGDNGLVYFDLNDFDEAILAPCIWDVVRLVSSIVVARGTLGLTLAAAKRHGGALIGAYAGALERGKAYWLERDAAAGPIGTVLQRLKGRSRRGLLARRCVVRNAKHKIAIDGQHAFAADAGQQAFVRRLIARFARSQPDPGYFRPIDVARRVAGTGSLGLERYVILVAGKGAPERMHLLDLKLARPSSSARHVKLDQPHWGSEAERIIAVQTRCQAVSPAFLAAVQADHGSFVLRDLQPAEDRLDLARIAREPDDLAAVFQMMGSLLAWDQLRASGRQGAALADDLMAFAAKTKWRPRLLDVATEAAERVSSDWEAYAKAFDHGRFKLEL